jgi:hypothetical protein
MPGKSTSRKLYINAFSKGLEASKLLRHTPSRTIV